MNVILDRFPRITVPWTVWAELMGYAQSCPIEVNGLGIVKILDDGTYFVSEVFILEQQATAHGVTSTESYLRFLHTYEAEGGDRKLIRLQWHTHPGEAYLSPTDRRVVDAFTGDWRITFVLNRWGDIYARFDQYRPAPIGGQVKVEVLPPAMNRTIAAHCRNRVADLVNGIPPAHVVRAAQAVPLPNRVVV